MSRQRIEISPGAAFLVALLFYCLRQEELLALSLAVLSHELGHGAAILLLGQRLTGFRAELGGFRLDYAGDAAPWGHGLIAAAGPFAGLAWAYAASLLGKRLGQSWLCLSAGMSLVLNLFNLLPAEPLDGGRILAPLLTAAMGERRAAILMDGLSIGSAVGILALGGIAGCRGKGAGLLAVGAWLLFSAARGLGLVKTGKIR